MLPEMNASKIYVIPTGFLLKMLYFFQCRGNGQHSMSANPDFNNISMDNSTRKIADIYVIIMIKCVEDLVSSK